MQNREFDKTKIRDAIYENGARFNDCIDQQIFDLDIIVAGLHSKKNSHLVKDWVLNHITTLEDYLTRQELLRLLEEIITISTPQDEENKGFGSR